MLKCEKQIIKRRHKSRRTAINLKHSQAVRDVQKTSFGHCCDALMVFQTRLFSFLCEKHLSVKSLITNRHEEACNQLSISPKEN